MTTISFNMGYGPAGTWFHAMDGGYFVGRREYPTADMYLYCKASDNKLYVLGRPGDALRVPTELAEPARSRPFYDYRPVDLEIIAKPII